MYILLVSSWFPSDTNPTFGSFVFEQAELLQARGHRVEVLQPVLSGSAQQTWKKRLPAAQTVVYKNIPVHYVPVNVWLPGIKGMYYRLLLARCIRFLKKHIAQHGTPNVIHSHAAFMGGVVAARISRVSNVPLVHTEHSSGFIFNPAQYNTLDKQWLQTLVDTAKAYLFVSRFAQEASKNKMGIPFKSTAVLPNLVHRSFFENIGKAAPSGYTALCIGNFSVLKNQLFLLDVWGKVIQTLPSAQLILAGSGFGVAAFQEKVKTLGLEQNVQVLPRLDRAKVKKTMAGSNMVLSASQVETFGLTLAEALATGTPVLATDSGGPRDIILPGDGFLVPPNDVDAFVQAVLRLFHGEHDTPEAISQRCQSRFGDSEIYTQLAKIYTRLHS